MEDLDTGDTRSNLWQSFLQVSKALIFKGLVALFFVWLVFTIGSLGYLGIRYSGENFPIFIHIPVLILSAGIVTLGVTVVSDTSLRERHREGLRIWFGPYALVALPIMILIVAIALFSSVTYLLAKRWPELLFSPHDFEVSESKIADFYLWHFLDLIPFLDVPGTLRWSAPLDYNSGWVGLLVLLFQAAVVLPSIQVIRLYFRRGA